MQMKVTATSDTPCRPRITAGSRFKELYMSIVMDWYKAGEPFGVGLTMSIRTHGF